MVGFLGLGFGVRPFVFNNFWVMSPYTAFAIPLGRVGAMPK